TGDWNQTTERGDEENAARIIVEDAAVSRERAQHHYPGLRIDPLKAGGGEEADRPPAGRNFAERLGERDLERQPNHVERAGDSHDRQDVRKALEEDVEPKPDDGDHQRE